MKTQQSASIVVGLAVALLGGTALAASLRIVDPGAGQGGMHPATLPALISSTLLVAGLGLATSARRARVTSLVNWPDRGGWRRVMITLASLVIYLALLEPLGFPLSTMIFVSFLVWFLGRYHPLVALGLGIGSAAALLILFVQLLGLPFPVGPDLG